MEAQTVTRKSSPAATAEQRLKELEIKLPADARIISTAGPNPKKGTCHEVPDFLSHDTNRWSFPLLQRGGPQRRTDSSPAARTALFVTHVRASFRAAF